MPRTPEVLTRTGSVCTALLIGAACSGPADPVGPQIEPSPSFEIVDDHEEGCNGRMTGGGFQIDIDGVRISRGLTLHCDITLSNNLQINWDGGKWHLNREQLDNVICVDDPNYDPFPPDAPFDTFIAQGTGRLNGKPNSRISFTFIDDGEPGTSDEAYITIYAPDQGPGQVPAGSEVIVLQVGGLLDGGNLQAHYDQPHSGNGNS